MAKQMTLTDVFKDFQEIFGQNQTPKEKTEKSIQIAEDSANRKIKNWSTDAISFLREFCLNNKYFTTAEMRKASSEIVQQPSELRAWGSVIRKASKMKWIEKSGFKEVEYENSNNSFMTVWKSNLYNK